MKYCNFGVSPVNHSDSEADFSDDKLHRGLNEMDGGSSHDDTFVISRDSEDENAGVFAETCILRTRTQTFILIEIPKWSNNIHRYII